MDRVKMLRELAAKRAGDPFPRYGVAMELRSQGRLAEAATEFTEIERDFPSYVPLYLMAGQVQVALGAADAARAVMERGVGVARAAGDGHAASELEGALAAL